MSKKAQLQIKSFYKKFRQAHDNSGYALVAVAGFYFLNTISFFVPENYDREFFHIQSWRIVLYSLAAILFYVNSFQYYYYKVGERKRISMYEMLKYCPVSRNDLKLFWMKKMIILAGSVAFAHTVLHVVRSFMMYGKIWTRTLVLPIIFEFFIPCLIVGTIIWLKKK